jgi:tetratricopeptide (TPR) repeat protein
MKSISGILTFVFIVLFSFVISMVVSENDTFANQEELRTIYEKNMMPCMNYWTTDPSYSDTVSMHMQAMRLYDKHEYGLALEAFQRFEPNQKEEGLYYLYTGICLLQSDLDNLAIIKFKDAMQLCNKFELIQLSRWYLSMAYLKTGNKKEAVETLNKIVELKAPQRYQAQNIIKEIDIASNPLKSMLAVVTPQR